MANKNCDCLIKLLTIGDSGSGKTSLLMKYTVGTFSPTFITTIGIDFKVKNIQINNKFVKLQIWDTAGQERFRTITTSYYKGSQGIFIVYDVTDRDSFINVKKWIANIEQFADLHIAKILIGNKSDLQERVVSKEEGQKLANEYKIQFFETSAKTGDNVDKAFDTLANLAFDVKFENIKTLSLKPPKPNTNNRPSCC